MKCECNTDKLMGCGIIQGGVALTTAVVGAIAAPFALTAATVSTVALSAGLFAAPALLFGLVTTGLYTFSPDFRNWADKHSNIYGIGNGVIFALLSAAAITAGVMLGLLTTSLMVVFIVTAVIGTLFHAAPFIIENLPSSP